MTANDLDLLEQFARENSQDAFTELVRRHVDLVYSAALRQVRSRPLAEDIAQSVFADLAREADRLKPDTVLTAWLYTVTRRTALNALRDESRRRLREQIAVEMNKMNATANGWTQIEPLLDDAMAALDETDRTAILLRYFENKSLREVGEALGASEDAAQKRVSRAVERLREFFSKRNVAIGASGLAVLISANAVQSAPVGLAAAISTAAALAGTAVSTSTVIATTKTIAMTTLQKTIVTATVAVLAGGGIYEARQAAQLREQNQTLQQQQTSLAEQVRQFRRERDGALQRLAALSAKPFLRLPAPPVQLTTPPPQSVNHPQSTNLFAGFQGLKDKAPNKLTAKQVEPYLETHGRNASSLLAAYRTTGDVTLLEEAMQKYPNDPQVDLAAALQKNVPPAERSQWLKTFEQSDPDNALPNYLSALDDFKVGQTDQAVRELLDASEKTQFQDYSTQSIQNEEQVYLAAGYSAAEANAIAPLQETLDFESGDESSVQETFATFGSQLSLLSQIKGVAVGLCDLAKSYEQAGDTTSAQTALQAAVNLGQHLSNTAGENGVSQLTGIAAEVLALSGMDPNSPYGGNGQTVQDQITQLRQQRAAIFGLYQETVPLLGSMSDQDWVNYQNRARLFGEPAALQWVLGKYGQK